MVTILIGADICPVGANRPYFIAGNAKLLFHDLLEELHQAHLVIANLEGPLIEQATPIAKTGPTFGEDSACINGIQQAGIDVLGLANNHIMDHGSAGLKNTLEVCARSGIATVGAGANWEAARQILVREIQGLRIGILAVAEHEFSIATERTWGANPLDIIDYMRNVHCRRKDFDYLIVLLHGSDEFHVPTPRIRNTCRFMVEFGANAVIVQHPHCFGGYESYQGGYIIYGQGALVMDEAVYRSQRSFHEGFLVKLSIKSDISTVLDIIPFVQSCPAPGARRMDSNQATEFYHTLTAKSNALKDEAYVRAQWAQFCEKRKHNYLSSLRGHGRWLQKLNTHGWLMKHFYRQNQLLAVRNIICCETHHEAVVTIFSHLLK